MKTRVSEAEQPRSVAARRFRVARARASIGTLRKLYQHEPAMTRRAASLLFCLLVSCEEQRLIAFDAGGSVLRRRGGTDARDTGDAGDEAEDAAPSDMGLTPDGSQRDGTPSDGRVDGGDPPETCGEAKPLPSTQGTWECASPMSTARRGHSATLLADGHILVTGAGNAEIYGPETDGWRPAPPPAVVRYGHRAVILRDGRVLVIGGSTLPKGEAPLRSCELYNPYAPPSGGWTEGGSMSVARWRPAVTVLRDGRVLAVSGDESGANTEIYDPGSNGWVRAAPVPFESTRASIAPLADGKVLLLGGTQSLRAALFDPVSGAWTPTNPLAHGDSDSAEVFALTGAGALSVGSRFVQAFDPSRGLWTTTGTRSPSTQLDVRSFIDGESRVFSAGGMSMGRMLLEASVFDEVTSGWIPAGRLQRPRVEHAATVLADHRVLIFGGCDEPSCARTLKSVEIFTPNSWSCGNGRREYPETCDDVTQSCSRSCVIRSCASSPPPFLRREQHALAYDFVRQRVVLFGGSLRVSTFDDVRELMGSTWFWMQFSGAPWPARRSGHAFAFDGHRGRSILFGGGDHNGALLADTWAWDGARWADVSAPGAPPPRLEHAMAWFRSPGRIVIHGGSNRRSLYDDTWEWDGSGWRQRANGPGRRQHVMVHDLARDRMIFFAGDDGSLRDDLWEYDGVAWREVVVSGQRPPARTSYAATYDAARDRMVVFGGTGTTGLLGDTWEWDGTQWHEVMTVGAVPAARSGASMTFDAANDRAILLGGWDGRDQLEDLWMWDGSSWSVVPFEPGCTP